MANSVGSPSKSFAMVSVVVVPSRTTAISEALLNNVPLELTKVPQKAWAAGTSQNMAVECHRMFLLASALAAGPQTPGHHITVGLGYSDFVEQRLWYSAKEAVFLADYRYVGVHGLVLHGEFSTAYGQRTYIAGLNPAWRIDFAGALSLRAGYERRFFGLENGVTYFLDPTEKGPLLSGFLWVGHPFFHAWTRRNPGTLIGDLDTMGRGFGVGSRTDVAHVEFGGWVGASEPIWSFTTEVNVNDVVWLGVTGRFLPVQDEWNRHETRVVLTARRAR